MLGLDHMSVDRSESRPTEISGAFSRGSRIRKSWEFRRVSSRGVRIKTPSFTVIAALNSTKTNARFGCAVSRKVGKAVTRNRIKRLMREAFRSVSHDLPPVDLVVIVRPSASQFCRDGLWTLAQELVPALSKASDRAVSRAKHKSGYASRR